MFLIFEIFLILFVSTFAQNVTIFQPGQTGIRIRFNDPLFSEAAQIFHSLFAYRVNTVQIPQQQQCFPEDSLFAYRVNTVQIPQQQQCFPEGCFALYNFRVTSFRQPRLITLKPLAPNYLLIDIANFDLDILGSVSGNLQIVLPIQISGGIVISTKSLSITATLDLQKNQYRQPYLRAATCELRGGLYDARVTDLGLLTESINIRYKVSGERGREGEVA
uniref:Uncharacterized protein n=1 Tax=Panagrolaimus sp. JU765 TaxID=591449 RepID=A0AC34QGM0_9BILA